MERIKKLEIRSLYLIAGLAVGMGVVVFTGGCSTVSGFSQLVGGVARDIGDAAEGARDHMAKNGPHL